MGERFGWHQSILPQLRQHLHKFCTESPVFQDDFQSMKARNPSIEEMKNFVAQMLPRIQEETPLLQVRLTLTSPHCCWWFWLFMCDVNRHIGCCCNKLICGCLMSIRQKCDCWTPKYAHWHQALFHKCPVFAQLWPSFSGFLERLLIGISLEPLLLVYLSLIFQQDSTQSSPVLICH